MAITVETTPSAMHAAFNEVEYKTSSDRYDAATNDAVIDSFADAGSGEVTVTTHANHGFDDGDVIIITGTTHYNGTYDIEDASTDVFNIVATWVSDDATGTATRSNENFKIKCDIKDGSDIIGSLWADVESAYFYHDIQNILQAFILSKENGIDIEDLGGSVGVYSDADQNGVFDYNLLFTEYFDNASGLQTSHDTEALSTIGGDNILSYNMVLQEGTFDNDTFTDYICSSSTKKFCTKGDNFKMKTGEELQLTFLTESTQGRLVYENFDSSGSTGAAVKTALVTINQNRGLAVIKASMISADYIEVHIEDNLAAQITEKITIYKDDVCTKNDIRIEFKNRLGGIDSYSFREAQTNLETNQEIIEIDNIFKTLSVNPKKTIKLIGQNETAENLLWLAELYTSKGVYLTDGTTRLQVAIVSSQYPIVTNELERPEIEIRLQNPKLN